MFQTEINHFFQSFASDELTLVMRFFTALGYQEFFLLFLLLFLLAIDFKRAFLLFMVLMWTGAITFFFKDYFDLPRPFHVDNTLDLLDGQLPDGASFDFEKRGASNFWGGLPTDVLQMTRQAKELENGFPSGHSSIAVAFWGALALLYRKRWISFIAIALLTFIPLSRIYLGVHFLADVLGGMILGGLILWAFYAIVLQPNKLSSYLRKDHYKIGFNILTATLLLGPLLFLLILPPRIYIVLAFMFGFGLGFLLLARKGLPDSTSPFMHRLGRTVVGVGAFLAVGFAINFIGDKLGFDGNVWVDFLRNSMAGLALVWVGTEVSIRLGWFQRIL